MFTKALFGEASKPNHPDVECDFFDWRLLRHVLPSTKMEWNQLGLGKKHPRKTLPQLIFVDPTHFFWCLKKEHFWKPHLEEQALQVAEKSQRIRIPPLNGKPSLIEFSYCEGTFYGIEVVERDRPTHLGHSIGIRSDVLNLYHLYFHEGFTRSDFRILFRSFKFHWFGDTSVKFTRKRCEEFFDDDSNFVQEIGE